ncbi:DUF2911 domain-containing protein [Abyssalbus ytuae]|uniref:DUF2911 domain-containing protein n=1 Tax=Abyssalbus ytuae TaxID=2926907 RepID=A0A9E6ZJY6_9FLAO|nr:DUF2911 domain-containing protein [Abyssalbus ytuae]UOB17009.1 DUF2911 domain-containing protein [Abyssalbus ytuae]
MKKLIFLFSCMLFSVALTAQLQTPAPSPFAKLEQKVGLTDVTLEYSRPSMKGRVIFGNLVPYGKLWRTGANARTKITFSDDVKVSGKELKAGTYAILTIPEADKWEVIFYTDSNGGGAPAELDKSKVAASVTAEVMPIPFDIQTFGMDINSITNNSANLEFFWEKTYVAVPFEVPTEQKTMASIDRVMAGPSANEYFQAALYYLQEGKDLNKAKEWIDKAVASNPDAFWMARQQSLIYAKLGDKKGAIRAAKASLAGAEKAGNGDYIKMNKESLEEWGAK